MKSIHSSGFAVSELIIFVVTTCLAIAKPDITTMASGYILKAAAREVAEDLQLTEKGLGRIQSVRRPNQRAGRRTEETKPGRSAEVVERIKSGGQSKPAAF